MTERDRLRTGVTPTFIPRKKVKPTKQHILLELHPSDYAAVKRAADAFGVSMKDFARQGVMFALEHLDVSQVK